MKTSLRVTGFIALVIAGICLSANAAIIGELGILDDTANGGINPETGVAWVPGDTYHLAFVTGTATINSTYPDISTYNAFVQAAATAAGLGGNWRALASTYNQTYPSYNPGLTNTDGIFLIDGITKLADNGADLNNGPDVPFTMTETGGTYIGNVATGGGRVLGDPGQTKIEIGGSNRTDGTAFWRIYNQSQTTLAHFYAFSEELTVQAIPEPSTAMLAGLALMGVCFRRRK